MPLGRNSLRTSDGPVSRPYALLEDVSRNASSIRPHPRDFSPLAYPTETGAQLGSGPTRPSAPGQGPNVCKGPCFCDLGNQGPLTSCHPERLCASNP